MTFSLRAKLIIVMSIVVTGATIGTAVVSQGIVKKAYADKFESDFKAEVRFFSQRQLQRTASIQSKCETLAASEALIEGIQQRQPQKIRPAILSELKEFYESQGQALAALGRLPPQGPFGMLGRGGPDFGKGGPQGKGKPDDADRRSGPSKNETKFGRAIFAIADRPMVAVVDAEGDLICMIDPEGKLMSAEDARVAFSRRAGEKPDKPRNGEPPGDKRLHDNAYKETLKKLATHAGSEQEVAYVTARGLDGREMLRSMVVTPVLDKDKKKAVGAVVLSVMTSDLGERELHRFSQETDTAQASSNAREEGISSGFWLDGVLHTSTIPKTAQAAVSEVVASRVEKARKNDHFHEADLSLPVDGEEVPHKVIFRVLNPDSPFPPACQVALYSLRDEIAEERAVQQKIMFIGLLALAVALALILLISRNLTQPVRDLVAGTEQIRAGNYDVRVDADRGDELGILANSFNEMAQGLRMNRKYQRLLAQFADRMVADQLINNESALDGELREVTVLFCDIRGFTKLTAGMPPHEVIAMINEHMSALTALVHDHYGVVDKFVGDMVMALFGAPSANGDDAERAALCALRMIEVREQLNRESRWKIEIGIGIATGTVVAGCMGSEARLDYTVLGEKVNLASRLCGEAMPGEILIDDTTLKKLGCEAEGETITGLELHGFDHPVTAYRLCGLSPSAALPS